MCCFFFVAVVRSPRLVGGEILLCFYILPAKVWSSSVAGGGVLSSFFIAAFLDMLAAFVYSNNNPFLLSSKRGFVCRLFLFLLLVRSLFLVTIFSRLFKPFFVPFSLIFFPTTFSKYFLQVV